MPKIDDSPEETQFTGQEQLAINVIDLDRIPRMILELLLPGKLDLTQTINANPKMIDEAAVPFCCDLLTACCICDTIRQADRRHGRYPTRVYIKRSKSWSRIPGKAALTVVQGEKVLPNPQLFEFRVSA